MGPLISVGALSERARKCAVHVSLGEHFTPAANWYSDGENLEPLVMLFIHLAHEEVGMHVTLYGAETEFVLAVINLRAFGVDLAEGL